MRLHLDGLTLPTIRFSRIFMFPSGSFFFVSTEIAGSPHRCRALTRRTMCSNWAFRSGCLLFSFNRLSARLQAVTLGLEQSSDFRAANDKTLILQFVGQDTGALACPP